MINYITIGLIFFLILVFNRYSKNAQYNQVHKNENGTYTFRLNKGTRYIFALFNVLLILLIVSNFKELMEWRAGLYIMFLFLLIGIIALLASINCKIQVNQERIIQNKIFFNTTIVYWKDISKVNFNNISQELILRTERNHKIKVHIYFEGLFTFIELMKSKLNESIYSDALKGLE